MSEKETRFTPGPWFSDGGTVFVDSRYQECCGKGVGECCGSPDVRGDYFQIAETSTDNASLIAAAPDLYAALQSLVSTVLDYERVNNLSPAPGRKYCWDATEQAIAALSKARGETP